MQAGIQKAEKATCAELKVVFARYCWGDRRKKAHRLFRKFHLDETAQHNAVLIMLVTTNRQFLIYGDEGIHRQVGQEFWDDVRDTMNRHFRDGEFAEGLCAGIERIGEKLSAFFPWSAGDRDEISNEIDYAW